MKHLVGFSTLALGAIALFALAAFPVRGDNDPQTPYIYAVNPESAKPGSAITVDGSYLGKSTVSEIYLTHGRTDVKLAITSQKTSQIVAKLPANLEPGRYRLMVLTVGHEPRFIEQPVQLTVE